MSDLPVGAAVRYFMQAMGQPTPDEPTHLDASRWGLRLDLIEEETRELVEAWTKGDLAAFLDACVDLVYVTVGTAVEAGLPFDPAFEAVHRANMAKLGPDGRPVFRDDGKVLKPVGWVPPDIASIIWKETDARLTEAPVAE